MRALRAVLFRPVGTRTSALVLGIVLLNLVDGFATLRHLGHGAEELNPLMRLLLARGAATFLVVKHLLASAGVLGIALHERTTAARVALWLLFPLYVGIAVYQIVLFAVIR